MYTSNDFFETTKVTLCIVRCFSVLSHLITIVSDGKVSLNFQEAQKNISNHRSTNKKKLMDLCLPLFIAITQGRGGKWYLENSGSRKFLFQSRNLGGILNES